MAARVDPPALAAWTLAFAVVAYLALSDGGYDTIVRSQVGVAVWWVVLLGALAGILPGRVGRAGWVPLSALRVYLTISRGAAGRWRWWSGSSCL